VSSNRCKAYGLYCIWNLTEDNSYSSWPEKLPLSSTRHATPPWSAELTSVPEPESGLVPSDVGSERTGTGGRHQFSASCRVGPASCSYHCSPGRLAARCTGTRHTKHKKTISILVSATAAPSSMWALQQYAPYHDVALHFSIIAANTVLPRRRQLIYDRMQCQYDQIGVLRGDTCERRFDLVTHTVQSAPWLRVIMILGKCRYSRA
jgi:hypothetical protein